MSISPRSRSMNLKSEIVPHETEQKFAKVPWELLMKLRLDLENIQLFLERDCERANVKEAFDIAGEHLARFGGKLR